MCVGPSGGGDTPLTVFGKKQFMSNTESLGVSRDVSFYDQAKIAALRAQAAKGSTAATKQLSLLGLLSLPVPPAPDKPATLAAPASTPKIGADALRTPFLPRI